MNADVEGSRAGHGLKIGIVVSCFHTLISERLLAGAREALDRHGVKPEDTLVVRVPGAFEIPLTAKTLAMSGKWDAVVCLGVVVRGQTTHHEHIGREAAAGIASIGLELNIPVMLGMLTVENLEQAVERSGGNVGNKGYDVALGAIEMANLVNQIRNLNASSPQ